MKTGVPLPPFSSKVFYLNYFSIIRVSSEGASLHTFEAKASCFVTSVSLPWRDWLCEELGGEAGKTEGFSLCLVPVKMLWAALLYLLYLPSGSISSSPRKRQEKKNLGEPTEQGK